MKRFLILFIGSFLIASLSHFFFLKEWVEGTYMTGPNDGLNQMLPFKQLIYENYTSGNFFYSFQFGFGGDFFGQLGYYFSTNVFFLLTIGVVYILELLHLIPAPDVLFWAQIKVFTSIIRMSVVILITTYVFRYFSIHTVPAFIGACLYGSSAIYFRHVTYWEFFADAFLFLPILIFGVEKIIREKKSGPMVGAFALTLFNNFYFAYILLLFVAIYLLVRWMIPLCKQETSKWVQFKMFSISGLLGFGIASIGFIPAVYAYLHNYRPAFNQNRPLVDLSDNLLLDSRTFLLSGIIIAFLFLFTLYKHQLFRFFACLTILVILFHYSPFMGSVFNGFSAPRNRFEFVGYFVAAGLVAIGIQLRKQIQRKEVYTAILITMLLYILFAMLDQTYGLENSYDLYMVAQAGVVLIAFIMIGTSPTKRSWWMGSFIVLLMNVGMMNFYQYDKLYLAGNVKETSKEYIVSEGYASKEQAALINRVAAKDKDPFRRLEWKGLDDRNNIPIIQDFFGTSVYSSILNENVLFWYYDDLEVDMKRESISRYSGFGDRANLYSIMSADYIMTHDKQERNIPYGFRLYVKEGEYQIYKNTNSLPFVRTSSTVFRNQSLEGASMLEREHAMLRGVILENPSKAEASVETVPNLISQAEIETVGATYKDGTLDVFEETGGLNLTLSSLPKDTKDLYVSFHLFHNVKSAPWFPLHVNHFETSRKSRESFYRTGKYDMTIRVPKDEQISIRVPEGNYQLTDLELYAEDYNILERISEKSVSPSKVEVSGNTIDIQLQNKEEHHYLTIPVPYEKGWHVTINGEEQEVLKANYAFLGVQLEDGMNEIKFTYRPPYLRVLLMISVTSMLIAYIWVRKRRGK